MMILTGGMAFVPPACAESPLIKASDPYKAAAESYRQRILEAAGSPGENGAAESGARTSEGHLDLARELRDEGRVFEALTHVQYALVLDPTSAAARELDKELRRAFDERIERRAKASRLIEKARKAEEAGKIKRAERYLKKAAALSPEDAGIADSYRRIKETGTTYDGPAAEEVRAENLMVAAQRPVDEYRVSRGDVIEVFVWQHNDLSRNVIVRPDGRISIPLVGDVESAGLTLTELDAIITDRLQTYVRFPDVSLAIKRFGGTKAIVLGEVARPGVYIPAEEGRIMELIAMAGGFTSKAEQQDVMLIRGGLAQPQVAKLNIRDVMTKGRLADNVALQPNDIVYVPEQRVNSVLDFLEQFYPTLQNVLVGQNIASNFGVYETSGAAAE